MKSSIITIESIKHDPDITQDPADELKTNQPKQLRKLISKTVFHTIRSKRYSLPPKHHANHKSLLNNQLQDLAKTLKRSSMANMEC